MNIFNDYMLTLLAGVQPMSVIVDPPELAEFQVYLVS